MENYPHETDYQAEITDEHYHNQNQLNQTNTMPSYEDPGIFCKLCCAPCSVYMAKECAVSLSSANDVCLVLQCLLLPRTGARSEISETMSAVPHAPLSCNTHAFDLPPFGCGQCPDMALVCCCGCWYTLICWDPTEGKPGGAPSGQSMQR